MNWKDNDKHHLPHFHAYYNEFEASFDLNGKIITGSFPAKQTAFVKAWALLHQDELAANWRLGSKAGSCLQLLGFTQLQNRSSLTKSLAGFFYSDAIESSKNVLEKSPAIADMTKKAEGLTILPAFHSNLLTL